MESQSTDQYAQARAESVRKTVHDVAGTIISIRALAETLAEHVPMLVAICRSKQGGRALGVAPTTMDLLPSLPAEIIKLCEVANSCVRSLGPSGSSTEAASQRSPGPAPKPARMEPDSTRDGPAALLVEDEQNVRFVLSETLRALGYSVTSARDGDEALHLYERNAFDLVLMDLRIPGVNGWETAKVMRKEDRVEDPHTPIIGITASPLVEDLESAIAAGMDTVIVKPIDESKLQSVLDQYVRCDRLRRA